MDSYRNLYNSKYSIAKSSGWSGWGSRDREEKGFVLLNRILANPLVPKTGNCLELGCGEGQLSRKLSKSGYDVTGVDVSDFAINWASEKTRYREKVVQYRRVDLTEAGIDLGGPFELIVDGNCLHCISIPKRKVFLNNVYKSLTSNGVFYVSSRCSKNGSQVMYDSNIAYRFFTTVENLLVELQEACFKVLQCTEYDRAEQIHVDVVVSRSDQ